MQFGLCRVNEVDERGVATKDLVLLLLGLVLDHNAVLTVGTRVGDALVTNHALFGFARDRKRLIARRFSTATHEKRRPRCRSQTCVGRTRVDITVKPAVKNVVFVSVEPRTSTFYNTR